MYYDVYMDTQPIINPVDPLQNAHPQNPLPVVPTETPKQGIPSFFFPALFIVLAIFSIVMLRNLMTGKQEEPPVTQAIPTPLFLTLNTPGSKTTAVDGEVLISGTTLPNTSVMIYSETDDSDTTSNGDGTFSGTVLIPDTGGLVEVSAFADNGEEMRATLDLTEIKDLSDASQTDVLGKSDAPGQLKKQDTVVATPQPQTVKQTGKPVQPNAKVTAQPTATPLPVAEERKIKQFVADKVIPKKPVKLGPAKLQATLFNESTGSGKQAGKTIRLQNLSMVQATSGAQMKRRAVSGIISAISDGTITLVHQIQQDRIYTVYYNAATVVTMKGAESTTGANLTINMRIAAVGELSGGGILAKRIHVIPGKAIGVYNKSGIATGSGLLTVTPSPEATQTGTPTATPTSILTITDTPTDTPLDSESPTPTP